MQALAVEDLLHQILQQCNANTDLSTLGPWLQHQITSCTFPHLSQIPFAKATYTRNKIMQTSEQEHGFEALIMRWDKQVKTSIHGHPAFSFYHVISGVFEMEVFSLKAKDCLELREMRRFHASDTTWFAGQIGRYDNFIHRVTCLEPGLTFHIYSEDAQKGIRIQEPVQIRDNSVGMHCYASHLRYR